MQNQKASPSTSLPPFHANLPRRKILLEVPENDEKVPLWGEIISSKLNQRRYSTFSSPKKRTSKHASKILKMNKSFRFGDASEKNSIKEAKPKSSSYFQFSQETTSKYVSKEDPEDEQKVSLSGH